MIHFSNLHIPEIEMGKSILIKLKFYIFKLGAMKRLAVFWTQYANHWVHFFVQKLDVLMPVRVKVL